MIRHLGAGLALAALFFAVPVPARSAPADPSQVTRILSEEGLVPLGGAPQGPGEDATLDRMIDNAATTATAQLGQGDPNWNPTNPRWKPVYDRVRADFAAGRPAAAAAVAAARPAALKDYARDIAAHLQSSDTDAILAYFNSAEGKRYLVFLRRVDAIMTSGAEALMTREPPSPNQPPQQQMQQDERMLDLSVAFQMAAKADKATGNPSAGSGVGYLIAAAINKNQAALKLLGTDYAADLQNFENFTASEPAQHEFTAMAAAAADMAKKPNPVVDWLNQTAGQHQAEWKALYQSAAAK